MIMFALQRPAVVLGLMAVLMACAPDHLPPETLIATKVDTMPAGGEAIIVAESAIIREGAGTQYNQVGTWGQGTAVTLLAKTADGDWYQVQQTGGTEQGWVFADLIGQVTAAPSATVTMTVTTAVVTSTLIPSYTLTSIVTLAAPCSPRKEWPIYIVNPDETLSLIAQRLNVSITVLQEANCLPNPNNIQAGQWLYIPPWAATATLIPIPTATATLIIIPSPTSTITPQPPPPSSTPRLRPTSTPSATTTLATTSSPTATDSVVLTETASPMATEEVTVTLEATSTPLPTEALALMSTLLP